MTELDVLCEIEHCGHRRIDLLRCLQMSQGIRYWALQSSEPASQQLINSSKDDLKTPDEVQMGFSAFASSYPSVCIPFPQLTLLGGDIGCILLETSHSYASDVADDGSWWWTYWVRYQPRRILVLPPITESSHRTTGHRLLHDKALPSQQKEGKPDISRSICSSVPEETNKIFIVSDK